MPDDGQRNQNSDTERDNIALVKRVIDEVWNDRRIDVVRELISPEAVFHFEHGEYKGINGWGEGLYKPLMDAIPDMQVDVEDIVANGDVVVTRWKARGTQKGHMFGAPPSGEAVELGGIAWLRLADGKVVENWLNWDMSYLLRYLLAEVKRLQGILPLCSFCKKVRDDKGYWEQVDVYMHEHSAADISHSICPECLKEHYPELYPSISTE